MLITQARNKEVNRSIHKIITDCATWYEGNKKGIVIKLLKGYKRKQVAKKDFSEERIFKLRYNNRKGQEKSIMVK